MRWFERSLTDLAGTKGQRDCGVADAKSGATSRLAITMDFASKEGAPIIAKPTPPDFGL